MTTTSTIDLDTLQRIADALADDTRRRILVELISGGRYPADLADNLSVGRTNISNHLACLRGCGLVTTTSEGRRSRYDLADPDLGEALAVLCSIKLAPTEDCAHHQ